MRTIDLNLDAGESAERLKDGSEEQLYRLVSSVNIACGGHAGDSSTMATAVALARKHGLAVGAHPSFPDRAGFGRKIMKLSREELVAAVSHQITQLREECQKQKVSLAHVKPHGALYHLVASDSEAAQAFIAAVKEVDGSLAIIAFAGSSFLHWGRAAGMKVIAEAFVDRRYEPNGSLRDRKYADAIITDPLAAGEQACQIAIEGSVAAETLCIHGDSPQALAVARAVRAALESRGVKIAAFERVARST